jgi:transposase
MPRLLAARPPRDGLEVGQVRKLAGSRHAPGDWILRARMVALSWTGLRVPAIAAELRCHPQTVRERLARFNTDGLDGLGDRAGVGRKPRLTEAERGVIIAAARSTPPGRPVIQGDRLLAEDRDGGGGAHWTLDALTAAVRAEGLVVGRSQVRRILLLEGVRWRRTRSWTTSPDPAFAPKGRRSLRSTPARSAGATPAAPPWSRQADWFTAFSRAIM